MRRIVYDDQYEQRVKEFSKVRLLVDPSLSRRTIRTRPRDSEELVLLMRLALKHKEKAIRSGKFTKLGPRRWRVDG